MYYAGIDLHRKYLVVAVLDRAGELVQERRRMIAVKGRATRAGVSAASQRLLAFSRSG